MTEIEKLYENAGVKKFEPKEEFSLDDCEEYCLDNDCKKCCWRKYPPFTAEKQLELIKWLCKTGHCLLRVVQYTDTNNWYMQTLEYISSTAETFENAIAGLINNLWQDLTEQEQQQIKEILE